MTADLFDDDQAFRHMAMALVDRPVEVFDAAPDLTQVTVVGWRCGWPSEAIICRLIATSADEAIWAACKIFNVSNDFVPAAVLCGWPAVRRPT